MISPWPGVTCLGMGAVATPIQFWKMQSWPELIPEHLRTKLDPVVLPNYKSGPSKGVLLYLVQVEAIFRSSVLWVRNISVLWKIIIDSHPQANK